MKEFKGFGVDELEVVKRGMYSYYLNLQDDLAEMGEEEEFDFEGELKEVVKVMDLLGVDY